MESEFISPEEAFHRLMRLHYLGKKAGNARRVRMALIGALRSGLVEWRCSRWKEIFTGESGATYTEGEVFDCPRDGWPDNFWQPALSHDGDAWQGNFFISYETVTMLSAPYKVRLWMASNDDAVATCSRVAEGIELNWSNACELLEGPGWQVWVDRAHGERTARMKVWYYEAAVIEMIAAALTEPEIFETKKAIFERLHEAFDTHGRVPDEKDILRLSNKIWEAIAPKEDPAAPVD